MHRSSQQSESGMDENPFMISHSIDSSPEVKEEEKSFREEERSMGSVDI